MNTPTPRGRWAPTPETIARLMAVWFAVLLGLALGATVARYIIWAVT